MKPKERAPHRERHAPTKAKRTRQGSQQTNKPKATTAPATCLHWPPAVEVTSPPLPGLHETVNEAIALLEVERLRHADEPLTSRLTGWEARNLALVITSPDAPAADFDSACAGDVTMSLIFRDELRARLRPHKLQMPAPTPGGVPALVETAHGCQVVTLRFERQEAALWASSTP